MEEFCVSTVAKVKDAYGWSDEIKVEDGISAWIGELPAYLQGECVDLLSTSSEDIDADAKVSMQDIASYQVLHIFRTLYLTHYYIFCFRVSSLH